MPCYCLSFATKILIVPYLKSHVFVKLAVSIIGNLHSVYALPTPLVWFLLLSLASVLA